MNQRRWLIISLFTLLALALAACGGDTAVEETATATPDIVEPEPTEEPTQEPAVEPAVTVADQTLGDDNTVVVPGVTAAEDGWIVIHADDGGAPGPVVGQAAVQMGENEDVSVEIDPEAATGTLYAMLHVDAGEAGTYEFPGDDGPVRDAEGNVVVRPFAVEGLVADVEPAVTVADQTLGDDNTVVVPGVTTAEDGWIVIHADDGGAPGPVAGYAAVTSGENEDVSVEIDPETATSTLYAMLHVDAGEAGTYEFPGDDGPVRDAEGNVVVRPFAVEGLAEQEAGGSSAGSATVSAVDRAFRPAELTISAGTSVVWTNEGSFPHTVTADNGTFDSDTLDPGDTFEFTFSTPGEYAYYCAFHGGPGGSGMAGTIIVEE